jgi:16S rRNA (uracil1498-N3)-methyltransferase
MNLFYCPEATANTPALLNEEESRHLVVLRKAVGDSVNLFDGKGNLFTSVIAEMRKRETVLTHLVLEKSILNNHAAKLQIAIAPPKNMDRMEWFAEKATEIGVYSISPIICQRSERRELKTERLFKIVLSAAKQSLKLIIPRVEEAMSFKKIVTQKFPSNTKKFIAYCEEKPIHLKDAFKKGEDICVLVGPEGDFTPEEITLAKANGFEVVSLGESRLRLETAGILVSAIFNLANE